MLSAAETRKLAGQTPRGGRFVAPLFFCLALVLLNLGLYVFLSPPSRLITELPYSLNGIDDWTPLAGDWVWRAGVLKQEADGLGLLVSPLRLTEKPTRLHLKLELGSGLSFAMRSARMLNSSHVLFLAEGAVTAGYIGSDGYFERQVTVPVDPAAAAAGLMVSVLTEGESYSLLLDHNTVAVGLPLVRSAGAIALLSDGPTTVQGVMVDADTSRSPLLETAPGLWQQSYTFNLGLEPDLTVLTGDWVTAEGKLSQTRLAGVDHALLFPEVVAPVSVEVSFEQLAGVGGSGLLLNVPTLTGLEGAHLIRLSEDAGHTYALWGYFDARRVFVRQGAVLLPSFDSAVNQKARLRVAITGDSFDLFVNGNLVADDVYLYSRRGHMGLTSSERAVAFDALTVVAQPVLEEAAW